MSVVSVISPKSLTLSHQPAVPGPQAGVMTAALDLIVVLAILFPVLGFLNPPDSYFTGQADFSLNANTTNASFPISTLISRIIHLTTFFILLRHGPAVLRELRYGIMIVVQFAVFGMSVLWSQNQWVTTSETLHFSEYIIMAAYVLHRYSSVEFMRLLTRLFALCAFGSFFVTLAFPAYGYEPEPGVYANAWRGVFINKNYLGGVSVMALVTCCFSWAMKANERWFAGISIIAWLLLLVLCRSATSIIATVICASIGTWIWGERRSFGAAVLLIGGVAGATLLAAALLTVSHPAELVGRTASLTGRTDVWRVANELIEKRPYLGYGLGFWSFLTRDKFNAWQEIGWAAPHAHNDMLDVRLQTGIFGLSAYIYNWGMALVRGVRLVLRKNIEGSFFFLLFCTLFFRSYSEVISVFPGVNTIMMVAICQLWINKILTESIETGRAEQAREIASRRADYADIGAAISGAKPN